MENSVVEVKYQGALMSIVLRYGAAQRALALRGFTWASVSGSKRNFVVAKSMSGAAFKQATEIAHVIGAIVCCSPYEAIIAVAAGIGQAAARGRKIASLSFIAEPLLRAALNGDDGPILNRRSLLPADELKAMTALATDALERFRRAGVPVDDDRLLGSLETERLADFCRRYELAAVEQGLAKSAELPIDVPPQPRHYWLGLLGRVDLLRPPARRARPPKLGRGLSNEAIPLHNHASATASAAETIAARLVASRF